MEGTGASACICISFIHKYVNKKFTANTIEREYNNYSWFGITIVLSPGKFPQGKLHILNKQPVFFGLKPVNEIIKNYDSWQTLECLPVNLRRLINYVPILTIFLSN